MSICDPEPSDKKTAMALYTDRASAEMKCKMQRMRLCTRDELNSNLCAGSKSDCKFGQTLVWTSTQCNVAAFATLNRGAEVSHKAIKGCPKEDDIAEPYTSVKVKFAVRCCEEDGSNCNSKGCKRQMTYDEAEGHCKANGYRLCTEAEVRKHCCKKGCRFDRKLIWVNDNDALPLKAKEEPVVEIKRMEDEQVSISGDKGGIFHILQYRQKFCTGTYVALEFNSLGQMTQVNIPKSKSPIAQPEVLCNLLQKNETDGTYVLHSCPGLPEGHCPANCNSCGEDYVKHFELSVCKNGWKLLKGPAPKDCTEEKKECTSLNQVDVGLARWCPSWPY